jgi:hypothetical protein
VFNRLIGNIDDFRIYNRTLTATEINNLYTYYISKTANINIKRSSGNLSFSINDTPIYTTPFTMQNTWTRIIWSIQNTANTPFIIIGTSLIDRMKTNYVSTPILSGTT